ncbi:hypothetical protein KGY79_05965 [Candidatus Bipolaricaulota bacterium]|nr:hypothetical protein [Candidatus Bipolaricaulota bacterium]
MKRKIITVSVTLLIIFLTFLQSSGAIGVSTLGIWVTIPAGKTLTGSLTFTNFHSEEAKLVIKFCDWKRSENGENILLEPNSSERSLIPYIKLTPKEAVLKPKESKKFKYEITMPKEVNGSLWGALLAVPYGQERIMVKSDVRGEEELPLNELARYGFSIKLWALEASSAVPAGEIKDLNVIKKEDVSNQFKLAFKNTGNVPLRPEGSLSIFDSTQKKIASFKLDKFVVLPESERILKIPGPDQELPEGDLRAEAVLKFGEGKVVKRQVAFREKE